MTPLPLGIFPISIPMEGNHILHIIGGMTTFLLLAFTWLASKRRRTRIQLSSGKCGLPTVCWMPRFVNYLPERDEQDVDADADVNVNVKTNSNTTQKKMPSSNITNILPRMERLGGPYGMYATVYGVSTKVIHVAHPTPAKAILMGNNSIPTPKGEGQKIRSSIADSLGAVKTPAYDHFKNFSGDGVFTADGNVWKAKRASLLHCLLRGCTKDNSPETVRLEREANRAADSFIANATSISSSSRDGSGKRRKDSVNIVPIMQRATIGLIFRFITHCGMEECFGKDASNFGISRQQQPVEKDSCDQTDDTDSDYLDDSSSSTSTSSLSQSEHLSNGPVLINHDRHTLGAKTEHRHEHDASWLSSYLEAITNIRMVILAQSRSIWFLLPRWFYRTFSSMFKEEEKQMDVIRKFARAACENAQPGSPLQLLRLKESHNPSNDPDVKNGQAVNQELLDEAITLLFAGQDTSAATLSWTLHLLSLYPNVQKRLAKEVRTDLASKGYTCSSNEGITKKMISKMSFLDAVIKEAMRLYPVAPFVVRRLPNDLGIPAENSHDENIVIPKDTFACIWIYGLHRNPKMWHRPDDFVPERWIDPEIQKLDNAQTRYKGTFMPFAAGPRNCVGQPLAQVILRIILSRIMNECEVIDTRLKQRCDESTEEERSLRLRKDMQAGFTVLPSGGLNLLVKKV